MVRGECIDCGAYLPDQDQQYCADCLANHLHTYSFKVRITDGDGWIWAIEEFTAAALDFSDVEVLPFAQELADQFDLDVCDLEVDAWVVDVS